MVNHKRVARIMAEDNLLCIRRRRFVLTTDSKHDLRVYLNLAARMELSGIDQLWVADLTYIRLREQFLYLAVILDAFSRRALGWALDDLLATPLSLAALRQAIQLRQPAPGLVHHSDRGLQYASQGVRDGPSRSSHCAQYESTRQPLRQCQVRELHENSQTGGNPHPRVS